MQEITITPRQVTSSIFLVEVKQSLQPQKSERSIPVLFQSSYPTEKKA